MVHRRKETNLQRRAVRRYVLTVSFRDDEVAETVCTATESMIVAALQQEFTAVDMSAVNVERGEVLINSRGEGTFQRR